MLINYTLNIQIKQNSPKLNVVTPYGVINKPFSVGDNIFIMENFKLIPLTKGEFAIVDEIDFDELNKKKWHLSYNGKVKYAARAFQKKDGKWSLECMHRVIMNPEKEEMVDHKNRNGLDNRRENLRVATRSENAANRKLGKGRKYLGISWNKKHKKWIANITKLKQRYYLGFFDTEEDAAMAYDIKAKELHGEFANLNFPNALQKLTPTQPSNKQ